MSNLRTLILIATAATLAAACTTTGTGVGNARVGDMHASFAWQSTDDRTGTLTASLSNGDNFTGKFFQVTHDTRIDSLGPLWAGVAGVTGGRRPIRRSSRTTAVGWSPISKTRAVSTCDVTSA
jgi:hypothetical protein